MIFHRFALPLLLFLPCCIQPPMVKAQNQPSVYMPLKKLEITSGYGYRTHPLTGKWTFHRGVDLAARKDTIFCALAGHVLYAGYHPQLGYHLRIGHGNVECIYAHLSAVSVRRGQIVAAGYPVGISGRSGMATGEHLHFAIEYRGKPVHPLRFLRAISANRGHPEDLPRMPPHSKYRSPPLKTDTLN